jgi:hypothetical protein
MDQVMNTRPGRLAGLVLVVPEPHILMDMELPGYQVKEIMVGMVCTIMVEAAAAVKAELVVMHLLAL